MKDSLSCLSVCVSLLTGGMSADGLPWDGTRLVFGVPDQNQTFTLGASAEATEIRFDAPATLTGAALTLHSPAQIVGEGGTVLNSLAGVDGLLIGSAYEESGSFFASKNTQVLWKGVRLAEVKDVTGFMCGSWGGGSRAVPDHIYFEKASNGLSATLQLQAWQGSQWTRTVLVNLEQSEENVTAKLVWAKYSSDQNSNGKDWLKNPSAADSGTHGEYSDFPTSETGIGITVTGLRPVFGGDITLSGVFPAGTVTNNIPRLIVVPQANLAVSNAFGGIGREIVYRNPLGERQTFERVNAWIGTEEILVSEHATIGSIEIGDVYIVGQYVNADCSLPQNRANFGTWSQTVGNVRTVQLQYHDYVSPDNDWTKTVTVEFRQDGERVWMKAVNMCYGPGDKRGQHITTNESAPCTAGSASNRGACNAGYGIWNLKLTCRSGDYSLAFTGTGVNAMDEGARFVLDGVAQATCNNPRAFPSHAELVLTNGSRCGMLSNGHGAASYFQSNANYRKPFTFTVHEGCELWNSVDWSIGPYAVLNLAGGRYVENNVNYIAEINLSGGAVVTGSGSVRVGYYDGNTCWRTLPGEACTITLPIDGAKRSSAVFQNVHTFDLAADLHLVKPIYDLPGEQLFGLNWAKTGPAVLHLEADTTEVVPRSSVSVTVGAFDIYEGTLACDADHVLSGENPIALKGGTLAAGSHTNAFGVLTVTADSVLTLAEGGQVAFADSAAVEWTGSVAVSGPWSSLKPGRIRFGTAAAGLADAQLRCLRYNDARVCLDKDGWLVTVPRGLVIFIK